MAKQVMQPQAEADEEDQAPDGQAQALLLLGAASTHSSMLAARRSLAPGAHGPGNWRALGLIGFVVGMASLLVHTLIPARSVLDGEATH